MAGTCALILASALAAPLSMAEAQVLNARRLGMGGVATSDNGSNGSANVAFRAVPKGQGSRSIPLPIGLVPMLTDPPEFDPDSPDFNVFEILNLVSNPPLTLTIGAPDPPSSDIAIFLARDSLRIDLEDVRETIPEQSMRQGGVYHLPGVGLGFGPYFAQVAPVLHVRNVFYLSPELRGALRDAEPFLSSTRYGVSDDGAAQAAIAFQVGAAGRLYYAPRPSPGESDEESPDPRRNGATALYGGAAPKYLLGLAYGEAASLGGFTTGDTLFGASDPVAFDVTSTTRFASIGGTGGAGHGYGADVGAVLFWNGFEIGVGVNDLVGRIRWDTKLERHAYVDSLNEVITTVLSEREPFTSRIPATTTINVARRFGTTTVAADVVDSELATEIHAGAERWLGMFAVRAGTYRDANRNWQFTVGTGARFGVIGVDLALATQQRNLEEKRAGELSASLALY